MLTELRLQNWLHGEPVLTWDLADSVPSVTKGTCHVKSKGLLLRRSKSPGDGPPSTGQAAGSLCVVVGAMRGGTDMSPTPQRSGFGGLRGDPAT